ncbi:MAG: bifunctional oligoribonuclease/PAP phosphatase NrnA [Lachnospiraceae bacterium]|nr:bifunctional oligoribonuclease/PAP phosphatase NrnA [Lachnospiraceae bacterium]
MNIKEICKDAERIGIGGHIRPDGDCVGSCLGLSLYLKKLFPAKEVKVFLEKPSDIFSCIKGFRDIVILGKEVPKEAEFDVFFAVDCGKERLGSAERLFDKAKTTVNIDHHVSNADGTGMYNYIYPEASSASELVYELVEEDMLDADIAAALYTGIVHDTGVFRYSCTSPKTMQAAAKLISYGFDFSKLIEETFYEKTYVQNQVMGRALLESMLIMDGKCIVSYINRKTMEFYQVTGADLEGIVSQLKLTKGAECAVFMYEIRTMQYKVSLRSGEKVNVAKIAELFGGGGHVRAAGCTMNGTFYDVINNLSVHIEEQLEEAGA